MLNSSTMINTRHWLGLVLWQLTAVIGVQYAVFTAADLLRLLPYGPVTYLAASSSLLILLLWLGVHYCTVGAALTRNTDPMLRLSSTVAKLVWYVTLILPAGVLGLITLVVSHSATRSLSLADVMLTWLLSGSWAVVHCLTIGPLIARLIDS